MKCEQYPNISYPERFFRLIFWAIHLWLPPTICRAFINYLTWDLGSTTYRNFVWRVSASSWESAWCATFHASDFCCLLAWLARIRKTGGQVCFLFSSKRIYTVTAALGCCITYFTTQSIVTQSIFSRDTKNFTILPYTRTLTYGNTGRNRRPYLTTHGWMAMHMCMPKLKWAGFTENGRVGYPNHNFFSVALYIGTPYTEVQAIIESKLWQSQILTLLISPLDLNVMRKTVYYWESLTPDLVWPVLKVL